MRTSRIRYIFTWVSLVVMLTCSTLLLVSAWNSRITSNFAPSLAMLLWILMAVSGIYLFMLAVKLAHRQWINEKEEAEKEEAESKRPSTAASGSSREKKELDFAAS
ncbi:MAG: hypothetical protein U9R49_13380, partial [Bacteroidota bacterium]|nr:hypothetical protein [Bacteroidota bacterium]